MEAPPAVLSLERTIHNGKKRADANAEQRDETETEQGAPHVEDNSRLQLAANNITQNRRSKPSEHPRPMSLKEMQQSVPLEKRRSKRCEHGEDREDREEEAAHEAFASRICGGDRGGGVCCARRTSSVVGTRRRSLTPCRRRTVQYIRHHLHDLAYTLPPNDRTSFFCV